MNINEKDIIRLDDENNYIVVKKNIYDNVTYYYIANINDMKKTKFLYEEGNELVELEDEQTMEKVIVKMFETIDVDDVLRNLKSIIEKKSGV